MNQSRPDPKNHMKSWVIHWKGNKPVLEQTTWAPGYTPGHTETEPEAIGMEMVQLMQHIADFREKWLNLNLLAEQHKAGVDESAFGSVLSVTETDDPHEHMTMPADAVDVSAALQGDADREAEMDDWADGDIPQHVELTTDNGPRN